MSHGVRSYFYDYIKKGYIMKKLLCGVVLALAANTAFSESKIVEQYYYDNLISGVHPHMDEDCANWPILEVLEWELKFAHELIYAMLSERTKYTESEAIEAIDKIVLTSKTPFKFSCTASHEYNYHKMQEYIVDNFTYASLELNK